MRIAAVSDIHGNLPALQAVLEDIRRAGADLIVNLGDIVSGPLWPAETAELLMAQPTPWPTLRGNHERQLLAPDLEHMSPADRLAALRLTPGQRAWVEALPATHWLSEDVFLCHGTPTSDLVYFLETVTPDFGVHGSRGVRLARPEEATERAGDIHAALILCGHTHRPRVLRLGDGRLVVNPGSVGLPAFDDDHPHFHRVENGSPHARYAVAERRVDRWNVELRAVAYDWGAAARQAAVHGQMDWAYALSTGFMPAAPRHN